MVLSDSVSANLRVPRLSADSSESLHVCASRFLSTGLMCPQHKWPVNKHPPRLNGIHNSFIFTPCPGPKVPWSVTVLGPEMGRQKSLSELDSFKMIPRQYCFVIFHNDLTVGSILILGPINLFSSENKNRNYVC